MRVKLMLTCLCDAFFGEVGIDTARVLQSLGCQVEFDERQTCCGQPPFNAGDWQAARKVAKFAQGVLLADPDPVVTPSGSCAAMIREGYPMLFPEIEHPVAFELTEFITSQLGIERWPHAIEPRRVAFHRACHGRAIKIVESQFDLVASIPGLEIVPFLEPEQCCGFGGAFCATHGLVSAGIGLEKLKHVKEAGLTEIVSGDMGCLMQLRGLIQKHDLGIKTTHLSRYLAEGIPA